MTQRQIGPVDIKAIKRKEEAERLAKEDEWLLKSLGPKNYRLQKAEEAKIDAVLARFDAEPHRPFSPAAQAALAKAHAKIWADVKPFLAAERKLLGVDQNASKRDIKNAYRRQARRLHPDKGGDPEAFKAMHGAYRRLLAATQE